MPAQAALPGNADTLIGLTENVIVGRLIPAGTGILTNRLHSIAARRDQRTLGGISGTPRIPEEAKAAE